MSHGTSSAAMIVPTFVPLLKMPVASARSFFGNISGVRPLPKQAGWREVDGLLQSASLLGGFMMDPSTSTRLRNGMPSPQRDGERPTLHVLQGYFLVLVTVLSAMAAQVHKSADSFLGPAVHDSAPVAVTYDGGQERFVAGFETDYDPALPLWQSRQHVEALSTQSSIAASTIARTHLQPGTRTHAARCRDARGPVSAVPRYDTLRTYRI